MLNHWSSLKKVGFLFLFFYFSFYISSLFYFIDFFWQLLVSPFAKLLGFSSHWYLSNPENGSGDTTYHFYQILLFTILAVGFSILTILLKSFRTSSDILFKLLNVMLRYSLAGLLISYGLVKLYCMQFPFPSYARLDQELGDFSPMGLLWNFMGYSPIYSMFTGALEFIAGLLLLSRYTSNLGALTTFGIMLNVMMLNYCYDVPVKLLSTHMVVMAVILITIDSKNLFDFFVLKRPVSPRIIPDIIPLKYRKPKTLIKAILITAYVGMMLYYMNEQAKEYGFKSPQPYFAGKYKIESFQRISYDGLDFNSNREGNWKTFYQTWDKHGMFKCIDGINEYYLIEIDTTKQIFKMKSAEDLDYQKLNYQTIEEDRFQLYGRFKNDSLNFVMIKENSNDRLLFSRKFRWINEAPFNK